MDHNSVYIRTRKGEDEAHSRTSHLAGDLKRALLMVDGESTFEGISKRAAPSLRASLESLFGDMEKGGFIEDRDKKPATPKMVTPPKMATPKAPPPTEAAPAEEGADLDFLGSFSAAEPIQPTSKKPSADTDQAEESKAAAEAERQQAEKLKAEMEAQTRQLEAEKLKAQQEAEAIRHKAEQEAKKLHDELEATRRKADQEAKMQLEAASRAKQEAEAARIKVEQDAARMRANMEAVKAKAAHETKARQESAKRAHASIPEQGGASGSEDAIAKAKADELAKAINQPQTGFAFDNFHLGEQQPLPDANTPTSPPTSGGFAFGSFQIETPSATPVPSPDKPAAPSEPAAKSSSFSFNSFQVDTSSTPETPLKNETPIPASHPPLLPADEKASVQEGNASNRPEQASTTTEEIEAIKRAEEQARKQAEEHARRRMAEEQLARKQAEEQEKRLAAEQAKKWAEAEQRALETAKSGTEKVSHQTVEPTISPQASPPPTPPVRKSFSLGNFIGFAFKLGIFLLVLLTGAIFALPYVMPLRQYIPHIEQLMSSQLKQPVHIGYLSAQLLPTPQLQLGELYIGPVKQFQADHAQLNFSFLGLLDEERKPIDSVTMQGVKISGKNLQHVTAWLQQLASSGQFPIRRISISQGALDADAFELIGVEGDLSFNQTGQYTQASFRANGGKYSLDISLSAENRWLATITSRSSPLPLLPNWAFDEISAEGELTANELHINNFDARILGGSLHGKASLNWRSGWRAQGEFTAKNIAMKQLNELLDGSANGSAHFKMTSLDLAGLPSSATLEGNFSSADGMISGVDIVETANRRSKEHLPGGRTHYKELSGTFAFSDDTYRFSQIKIATEVMDAVADMNIKNRQLSGNIRVSLTVRESSFPVELQIEGATDTPKLHAAR